MSTQSCNLSHDDLLEEITLTPTTDCHNQNNINPESDSDESFKSVEKFEPIKLNFLRKFAKFSGKISRKDFEEILLQKITESMVYNTEYSKLRTKLDSYEELIQRQRNRIELLVKQYNDLEVTHSRILQSLRENPQELVEPLKIVRSVSCQAYQSIETVVSSMPEPIVIHESPEKRKAENGVAGRGKKNKRNSDSIGNSDGKSSKKDGNNKADKIMNNSSKDDKIVTTISTADSEIRANGNKTGSIAKEADKSALKSQNREHKSKKSLNSSDSSLNNLELGRHESNGAKRISKAARNTSKDLKSGLCSLNNSESRSNGLNEAKPSSCYTQSLIKDFIEAITVCKESGVKKSSKNPTDSKEFHNRGQKRQIKNSSNNAQSTLKSRISSKRKLGTDGDCTLVPERSSKSPTGSETDSENNFKVPTIKSQSPQSLEGEMEQPRAIKKPKPGPMCSKISKNSIATKNPSSTSRNVLDSTTKSSVLDQSFSSISSYSMFNPPTDLKCSANMVTSTPLKAVNHGTVHLVKRSLDMSFNESLEREIQKNLPPLPQSAPQMIHPRFKQILPAPSVKVEKFNNGIKLTWRINNLIADAHPDIQSFQIFAYEESDEATKSADDWKLIGDVKALLLPMAVTLREFSEEQKFHFVVRAVDVHKRFGDFSRPKTWE